MRTHDHNLPSRMKENLLSSRFGLGELSGSLGDMGTFIPLTAALIAINGLKAGPVLFFAGLFNVTTGMLFGIPMCVQPMKIIAAVAISENLSPAEIHGAGLFVGAFFLLTTLFGLIDKIEKLIPRSVVRGLQLGIGLNLMMKGLSYVTGTHALLGMDSIVTGIVASLIVLLFFSSRRFPSSLVLFTAGSLMTLASAQVRHSLALQVSLPSLALPNAQALLSGALDAGLAQIPLTLLNSVIAVCALSEKLFPRKPASVGTVAASVGVMNLTGCLFGAMPVCHGAGGLAGQYRFGARTAGSMIILGSAKMLAGLFTASAITSIMLHYPMSILGVLLIVSGLELGVLVRDQKKFSQMFVALVTAATILALGTLAGFLVGLFCALAVERGVFKYDKPSGPGSPQDTGKNGAPAETTPGGE